MKPTNQWIEWLQSLLGRFKNPVGFCLMVQILSVATVFPLAFAEKVCFGSTMAARFGVCIQMQPCGLWGSKALLHPSNSIALSTQVFGFPRPWSLGHREHASSVHRGPPCCMSVEVGKEDNSPVERETKLENVSAANPRVRPEEKFAVLYTGQYECSSCGYIYDQALGDPFYPIAPGIEFPKLPDDWRCPTCGAAKSYFKNKSVEVAGFAENQQFGLGANALTSTQKSVLIYGSLLFFFILFLAGYFIQ